MSDGDRVEIIFPVWNWQQPYVGKRGTVLRIFELYPFILVDVKLDKSTGGRDRIQVYPKQCKVLTNSHAENRSDDLP